MAINLTGKVLHADPNVTPLIDVLLVLLIIFMVIVPIAPQGLRAVVPQPPKDADPAIVGTVIVRVIASPSGPVYTINQSKLADKAQLVAALNRIVSVRAEKALFLQGDPTLDFSAIAEVLDISRAAGIDHIGILTPASTSE